MKITCLNIWKTIIVCEDTNLFFFHWMDGIFYWFRFPFSTSTEFEICHKITHSSKFEKKKKQNNRWTDRETPSFEMHGNYCMWQFNVCLFVKIWLVHGVAHGLLLFVHCLTYPHTFATHTKKKQHNSMWQAA